MDRLEIVEVRARQHIDERTDSLGVYPLCARCAAAIRAYGTSLVVEEPDVFIV